MRCVLTYTAYNTTYTMISIKYMKTIGCMLNYIKTDLVIDDGNDPCNKEKEEGKREKKRNLLNFLSMTVNAKRTGKKSAFCFSFKIRNKHRELYIYIYASFEKSILQHDVLSIATTRYIIIREWKIKTWCIFQNAGSFSFSSVCDFLPSLHFEEAKRTTMHRKFHS